MNDLTTKISIKIALCKVQWQCGKQVSKFEINSTQSLRFIHFFGYLWIRKLHTREICSFGLVYVSNVQCTRKREKLTERRNEIKSIRKNINNELVGRAALAMGGKEATTGQQLMALVVNFEIEIAIKIDFWQIFNEFHLKIRLF